MLLVSSEKIKEPTTPTITNLFTRMNKSSSYLGAIEALNNEEPTSVTKQHGIKNLFFFFFKNAVNGSSNWRYYSLIFSDETNSIITIELHLQVSLFDRPKKCESKQQVITFPLRGITKNKRSDLT